MDKENKTRPILCVDFADKKEEMTLTSLLPTQLIEQHEGKLIANVEVSITNFEIIPKHKYDSGDYEKTISLTNSNIVEKGCLVSAECRFSPNMMIANLSHNQDLFPIGTISAISISATQTRMQYALEIKDDNVDEDRAIINLGSFECFNDNKLLSTSYMIYMYCFTNISYVIGSIKQKNYSYYLSIQRQL